MCGRLDWEQKGRVFGVADASGVGQTLGAREEKSVS